MRLDQVLDLIAEVQHRVGRFRLDSDGGWALQAGTPLAAELPQLLDDLSDEIQSILLLAGEALEVESPLAAPDEVPS